MKKLFVSLILSLIIVFGCCIPSFASCTNTVDDSALGELVVDSDIESELNELMKDIKPGECKAKLFEISNDTNRDIYDISLKVTCNSDIKISLYGADTGDKDCSIIIETANGHKTDIAEIDPGFSYRLLIAVTADENMTQEDIDNTVIKWKFSSDISDLGHDSLLVNPFKSANVSADDEVDVSGTEVTSEGNLSLIKIPDEKAEKRMTVIDDICIVLGVIAALAVIGSVIFIVIKKKRSKQS